MSGFRLAFFTSNHMIWDKLPECIFENGEIDREKRGQYQNFKASGQLQNNTINSVMSITISCVITKETSTIRMP